MNFPTDLFAGRRFAVLGLGRNGLPAAQALAAMGATVVAWDDKTLPLPLSAGGRGETPATVPGAPLPQPPPPKGGDLEFELRDPAKEIATFDALILSPGIPHNLPAPHPTAAAAIAAGIPVWSDAEMLYQAVRAAGSRARFIGITGTNGKSTTTALVAHILATAGRSVEAGGNLGPAALSLSLLDHNGLYVLEMSSYMLERIGRLRFDAAAMLNLSPDHLDRHGSMALYAAAKRSIFDRQELGDLAVVGTDDALSRAMAVDLSAITISGEHKADVWFDGTTLRDAIGPILAMAEAHSLPGYHNAQNAAAAAAIALHLGLDHDQVAAGMISFAGLPHRQQLIATVDGVTYVNDSKATNADSVACALACYDRVVWIAGGVSKEGGIASLAPFFHRIAHVVLIGRDAEMLAAQRGAIPYDIVGTLERAVPMAREAARRTGADIVLLSPACASFDQFSGFDARGDRFAELVHALVGSAA
jgi:UDP-N-acetylmuramoylalanine--D-glutamate ligase